MPRTQGVILKPYKLSATTLVPVLVACLAQTQLGCSGKQFDSEAEATSGSDAGADTRSSDDGSSAGSIDDSPADDATDDSTEGSADASVGNADDGIGTTSADDDGATAVDGDPGSDDGSNPTQSTADDTLGASDEPSGSGDDTDTSTAGDDTSKSDGGATETTTPGPTDPGTHTLPPDSLPLDAGAPTDAAAIFPPTCSLDAGTCGEPSDASESSATETETDTPTDTEPEPDECPEHADQTERGACGCGFESTVTCAELEQHLVHRYSFDGTGNTAFDSVADADGECINIELDGSGTLSLDGSSQYVELPAGIASEHSSATLEAWVEWHGGDANQRIFNFGTPVPDEAPSQFISLTPAGGNDPAMTVAYRAGNASAQSVRADFTLATDSVQHVTTVFDASNDEILIYVGSELVARSEVDVELTELEDQANWLGRALYSQYPFFDGHYLEFRIYDAALSHAQVTQSDELGPDATFSAEP